MDQGYNIGGIQGDMSHAQEYQQRSSYRRVSGKNINFVTLISPQPLCENCQTQHPLVVLIRAVTISDTN